MEYVIFAIALVLLLLFFFFKSYYDYKKEEKRFIIRLHEDYGTLPQRRDYAAGDFLRIAKYYEKHKDNLCIDDITWNDLNMDEVFKRMNYTLSSAGEEYLYYLLRRPSFEQGQLLREEEIIRYFQEHEEVRVSIQFIYSKLGRMGKFSIHDYLDYLDTLGKRSNLKHLLSILLLVLSVFILFVNITAGILLLIGVLIYNNISYFKEKNNIDPYITSFAYIFRILNTVRLLQTYNIEVLKEEWELLSRCSKSLNGFKRGSFLLMSSGRMSGSGNPFEILVDFIRMGFHLDLMKFNQMLSEVRKHTKEIDNLITALGKLEAMIAIGAYRASVEAYCIPEFCENTGLNIVEMYHPLIDNPVKNTIETNKNILITGSNASGKSTFLKTVALNCIMAQTIHTCLATQFTASIFRICSSMTLRDDLQGGSSYFMVEIKALKRILDMIRDKEYPVLCFVDEVLRGTNTVERIAASTQILKSLSGSNCLCFAATHDIELTHLLEASYTNYHFSEEIEDNDISFSYKILGGRATTRNAIKLLGIMGYEQEIIHKAEEMAGSFVQTGSWNTETGNQISNA